MRVQQLGWWGLGVTVFGATLGVAGDAYADWPMARHDATRSGATDAGIASNLQDPVPYWRAFVGGYADSNNLLPVEGASGAEDVALLSYGRVSYFQSSHANPDWETDVRDANRLVRRTDLDGDGRGEIVVQTDSSAYVLDQTSGAVLWALPPGLVVSLAGVRIADFDDDGLDDLLLQNCKCCGVVGGRDGGVFSFKFGFDQATLLWELPPLACVSSGTTVALDLNADARTEVTVAALDHLEVLDGATGATLFTSPPLAASLTDAMVCMPTELDGAPGQDLLCSFNVTGSTPSGPSNRLMLWHATASGLATAWEQGIGPVTRVWLSSDAITDFDADGSPEVVAGGVLAGNVQASYVLDGTTGAVVSSISGQQLQGNLPEPDGRALLIARDATHLSAFSLEPTGLTLTWQLENADVLRRVATAADRRNDQYGTLTFPDTDGDGATNLVVTSNEGRVLTLYSTRERELQPVSIHELRAPAIFAMPIGESSLLVSLADGTTETLDAGPSCSRPRLRFGGYYASGAARNNGPIPVVGRFAPSGPPRLVAPTSAGALRVLDARRASLNLAPRTTWELPSCNNPVLLGTAGLPRLACVAQRENPEPTSHQELLAVNEHGEVIWRTPLMDRVASDVIAGNLNGDGVPDLVYQWTTTDPALRTTALDGATGAVLWTSLQGSTSQPYGAALADWDEDGFLDVVYYAGGLHVLSGPTGQVLATRSLNFMYGTLTPLNLDGDPELELVFHDGYDSYTAFDHDLSTTWTAPNSALSFSLGAIANCEEGAVLVGATRADPGRLSFYALSGSAAGSVTSLALSGGSAYADTTAIVASGLTPAGLSAVSVHADLAGAGPVAVVGAADGWLYGVDACTQAVLFTLDFDAPVGASLFGDTDADGLDELIVSTADGFVYGLKQPALAAPAWVNEVTREKSTDDIDELRAGAPVALQWAAVPGAKSYEVSIANTRGESQLSEGFKNVGARTRVTLSGLRLKGGESYAVSVRARASGGVSADTLSDGFVVLAGGRNQCSQEPSHAPPPHCHGPRRLRAAFPARWLHGWSAKR